MRLGERAEQKFKSWKAPGSLRNIDTLEVQWLSKVGSSKSMIGNHLSKSTVALHAVAQAQKEGALLPLSMPSMPWAPSYAAALGVNISELLLSRPDSGEQGLEIAGKLIDSGALTWSSSTLLLPWSHAQKSMEISVTATFSLQARMIGQAMRKRASINKTKTIAIFSIIA